MPRAFSLLFHFFTIPALLIALPTPAETTTINILYTFQGLADGGRPFATLFLDEKTGILYGTTEDGGEKLCGYPYHYECGTIFSLTPSPSGWTETVLYNFQAGSDGALPRAPLIPRPDGYFYSTTFGGGDPNYNGTVYRIQRGTWEEDVLLSFSGGDGGYHPVGQLAFDTSGNLYGTTFNGGAGYSGVAYELIPNPSGPWTENVLYGNVGLPYAGVVLDSLGNVYGTSTANGDYDEGNVYELSPQQSGWQFTNLYSFQVACGINCGGSQPGDLTMTKSGHLFGFAAEVGIPDCNGRGCGTVFEMIDNKGTWQEKTLYQFQNLADGWGPLGAPAFDSEGNIYGATGAGGQYGFGTVFKLSRAKGGWTKTTLYDFPGGAGGWQPMAGVIVDKHGNIFGTTYYGGKTGGDICKKPGCGLVFEIMP